jgi:hypothetical protein
MVKKNAPYLFLLLLSGAPIAAVFVSLLGETSGATVGLHGGG